MKALKITVLVLLALNFLVPAFQSCTKDSNPNEQVRKITLESLVKKYNENVVFGHEKAIFMEGEITVMTLPSKEVLFFLSVAGKTTNEVFLGQGTVLSSMIQKELGKSKVAYLREALAIETEAGQIYTFTIGERKGHEFVQQLAPTWLGKGYGLAYNYNRAEGPSDYKGLSSTDERVHDRATPSSCKCEEPQDIPAAACTDGGTGASSCSIGATVNNGVTVDAGCMINCQQGWFACCKRATQ